ncbi:MoaD/ThiS family protein [Kitasatospora purpeofusca]|uniref:MoaD/ThiS family protein n=1 Tax=Kitasatospora purpeofusca TaxID=67352 RepID=UPI003BF5D49A
MYPGPGSVPTPAGGEPAVVAVRWIRSRTRVAARILDDTGKLRRFVNVYVNDDDVRFAEGLETEIKDGASISIIPAVAGG